MVSAAPPRFGLPGYRSALRPPEYTVKAGAGGSVRPNTSHRHVTGKVAGTGSASYNRPPPDESGDGRRTTTLPEPAQPGGDSSTV